MLESERITEQIVAAGLDDRLVLAILEVARQVALLTERLSDLPVEFEAEGTAPSLRVEG